MARRNVLVFISAVLILGGITFLLRTDDGVTPKPLTSAKDSVVSYPLVKEPQETSLKVNHLAKANTCLGVDLSLTDLSRFDEFVKTLGAEKPQWHWDNFVLEIDGETRVLHVVSDQNQNGIEVLKLKVFREDDDGPTLLEEQSFLQRSALEENLKPRLLEGTLKVKQTVDSFGLENGVEVKRTAENSEITELIFRGPKGILDCKVADAVLSCDCK